VRVKALVSRLTSALKRYPGEVSERGGRMCVAAPAGTKLNNAALLGTSPGGGLSYLEPAALVALNNELLAARAEAMSAEEGVLWELTGRLMGCLDDVQTVWGSLELQKDRRGRWFFFVCACVV
jgi:hypothetical protein